MNLFDTLTPNTTLLTPNRRLSAALLKQYNAQQIQNNKSSWEQLDILPFTAWLQRLWKTWTTQHITPASLQLTGTQELVIWEDILRQSPEHDGLLQLSAAAELAKSAWELLTLWEVDITDPVLSLTEDGKSFQQWARHFKKKCAEHHWIDTHSLTNQIIDKLKSASITLPDKIILIGFAEIPPQHKTLLDVCENQGCEINHFEPHTRAASIQKISLIDEETEIRTMARWAKSTYQQQPDQSIGCVIPSLESKRESVLKIFSDIFCEDSTFTANPILLPFNISAGKNLASFPIIHTALELLSSLQDTISIEKISGILRSPFLGDAEREQIKRANFENRLRKSNTTSLTLKQLISSNARYTLNTSCPVLASRIKNVVELTADFNTQLPTSAWVNRIIEVLYAFGWPGERSLNSNEYQVTQRWLDLLNEYRGFDNILPSQTYGSMLAYFKKMTTKTIFQTQTPDAPIQLLGVLEAAEMPIDHLWVMGLNESNWPAAPKPNPFIPLYLQKKLQMPHSTAEREYAYCEHIMRQFKRSVKHVIFSHAMKMDDIELHPSSLLNDIEAVEQDDLQLNEFISPARTLFATKDITSFEDHTAPSLTEDEKIYGGTSIFKYQAACPFKAFAELRLFAKPLESPQTGLRPTDRGNIAHKALEVIWNTLKDHETLTKTPLSELTDLIQHASKEALKLTSEIEAGKQRYFSLELQRLEKLLFEWLTMETARPPFKVIATEQKIETTVGNIPVTVKIDRIDELDDGSHLVIDYKTGKNYSVKSWFSDRPDDPQLPLYSIVDEKNNQAIAFGQINPDDSALIGISKRNLDIKTIKLLGETPYATTTHWEDQRLEWKTTLEYLGKQFASGDAKVDPKENEKTCEYCHLHALCRIYEKQQ